MTITYTSQAADKEIKGDSFVAYRWYKRKDSLVVEQIWEIVKAFEGTDATIGEISDGIKSYYKTRKVKSQVDILYQSHEIEIVQSGVLPNILIYSV